MDKLIANENAYQTLAACVRGGRLSHAILIEGPPGCGKTTFAREAAQAAMCSAVQEQRPCGQCRDCVKVEKNLHPDLLVYRGEGGSRSFHVDTVRALRQEAFVRAGEASCKVILLQNAQEASVQAQNALLKVIEEPPPGVLFLLTCENRALMLETILSRVQTIALQVPDETACAQHLLQTLPEADPEGVRAAARQAGGNVGAALALMEAQSPPENERIAELLYNACIGEEFAALTALAAYDRDRQAFSAVLAEAAGVLSRAILHPPEEGPLARLAVRAGRLRLLEILAIIEDTAQAVQQNVNTTLLLACLCARMRSVLADR